jgi:hypothetical protein
VRLGLETRTYTELPRKIEKEMPGREEKFQRFRRPLGKLQVQDVSSDRLRSYIK